MVHFCVALDPSYTRSVFLYSFFFKERGAVPSKICKSCGFYRCINPSFSGNPQKGKCQTVQTQMRRRKTQRLIRVSTVCKYFSHFFPGTSKSQNRTFDSSNYSVGEFIQSEKKNNNNKNHQQQQKQTNKKHANPAVLNPLYTDNRL